MISSLKETFKIFHKRGLAWKTTDFRMYQNVTTLLKKCVLQEFSLTLQNANVALPRLHCAKQEINIDGLFKLHHNTWTRPIFCFNNMCSLDVANADICPMF